MKCFEKKITILALILLTACSNINKKEYYYTNSVKINVSFDKAFKSFNNGYLQISLYSITEDKLIEGKKIYNVSHKLDEEKSKNILANFKKIDKGENKSYLVVELFADTDNDNVVEIYRANIKNKGIIDSASKVYKFEVK